jgi:hypothetical protein
MSFTTATAGRAGFVRLGSGIGGQSDGSITASASSVGAATSGQTFYLGTTQIAINRASGAVILTGITSIDGTANATSSSITFNTSGGAASGTTFNGSTPKTIDYSTVGAAAAGQQFYLGTTQVAINRTSGALTLSGVTVTSSNRTDSVNAPSYASPITDPLAKFSQYQPDMGGGYPGWRFSLWDGPTENAGNIKVGLAGYADSAGTAATATSADSATTADLASNSHFSIQRAVPSNVSATVTSLGSTVLNIDYNGWNGTVVFPSSAVNGQIFIVTSYYNCTIQAITATGYNISQTVPVNFGGTSGPLRWIYQQVTSSWIRV